MSALKPYKILQQSAKSNEQQPQKNKLGNKWHVLPAAKARWGGLNSERSMKPRLSELNTDAVRRVLITM